MDQPGFKKRLFPTFFLKSRGHFEGSDFQPFVILARVPDDFKVVFDRLFSDIWKWSKMVENGSGGSSSSWVFGRGGVDPPAAAVDFLPEGYTRPGKCTAAAGAQGG